MGRLSTLKPRLTTVSTSPAPTVTAGSWRSSRNGSSAARGYGYAWQQLRADHLRSNPHCVYCLRELHKAGMPTNLRPVDVVLWCAERGHAEPVATIGDHVTPHQGRADLLLDRANVQSLCKTHHDRDKAREERAAGYR